MFICNHQCARLIKPRPKAASCWILLVPWFFGRVMSKLVRSALMTQRDEAMCGVFCTMKSDEDQPTNQPRGGNSRTSRGVETHRTQTAHRPSYDGGGPRPRWQWTALCFARAARARARARPTAPRAVHDMVAREMRDLSPSSSPRGVVGGGAATPDAPPPPTRSRTARDDDRGRSRSRSRPSTPLAPRSLAPKGTAADAARGARPSSSSTPSAAPRMPRAVRSRSSESSTDSRPSRAVGARQSRSVAPARDRRRASAPVSRPRARPSARVRASHPS